jgi:putative DNA primase/helicase
MNTSINVAPQLPTFYRSYLEALNNGAVDFETIKSFSDQPEPFAYTELGNAKRLPKLTNGRLLWVPELDKFAVYKDGRWTTDDDYSHIRIIDLLLENLDAEIKFYEKLLKKLTSMKQEHNVKPVEDELKRRLKFIRSHYLSSQRKSAITAAIELFKSQPNITVRYSNFDNKGHFIGCPNGVVDTRTGKFVENDPSYLMMKSTGVKFDPDATCPKFLEFLDEIFQGDQDKIDFQQQISGQACIGSMNKNIFTMDEGIGANGKSVKNDLKMQILGDYASQVSTSAFMGKTDKAEYVHANLIGVRFVCMNESEQGDKLAGSVVKACVDSGLVTARHPFGRGFEYQPHYTPVLSTNHIPYIGLDPAIWRRIVIISHDHIVPKEKRDPNLRRKLFEQEGSGIFNWMLEGAKRVQDKGEVIVPQSIIDAQEQYKQEFDKVGQYLSDCCVEKSTTAIPEKMKARVTTLREGYAAWCKANGYKATSTRNLKAELKKKGFRVGKGTGGHEYAYGIDIRDFDTQIALILPDDENQSLMEI